MGAGAARATSPWPAARIRRASPRPCASPASAVAGGARHAVRALGLDLGSRRIGVAVSDRSGTVASPLTVLQRTGSRRRDHERITALWPGRKRPSYRRRAAPLDVRRRRPGGQGCPGRSRRAGYRCRRAGRDLRRASHHRDRRTRPARRRGRGRARRQVVDKVAAAVILQSWLDARASAREAADEHRRRAAPGTGRPARRRRPRSDATRGHRRLDSLDSLEALDWRRIRGTPSTPPAPSSGCGGRRGRRSGWPTR